MMASASTCHPTWALSAKGHFGLMDFQERAELIGALLSIETAPGHGTQIIVSVNT